MDLISVLQRNMERLYYFRIGYVEGDIFKSAAQIGCLWVEFYIEAQTLEHRIDRGNAGSM